MKLVFATRNAGKMRELADLIGPLDYEVLSLDDVGYNGNVVEDEPGFAGNACKKARVVCEAVGLPVLADDSGLEVDALGGEPGVRSARYSGADATDLANMKKLLAGLAATPEGQRTARFRCALAYVEPRRAGTFDGDGLPTAEGRALVTEGTCEGEILREPRGSGGFGYDPLFFVPVLGKTFAELSVEEKNRLSHRAKAFQQMVTTLASRRRII